MCWLVNKDNRDYEETFRDVKYKIPGGGKIKLPRREAIMLKGQYVPMDKDGNGVQRSVKSLAIVNIGDESKIPEKEVFKSALTGEEFETKQELEAHYDGYKDKVYKDEDLDKELEKKKK